MSNSTVEITPSVKIYGLLKALQYTFYHALGEYIDNSIQSYLDHEHLLKYYNSDFKLNIKIKIDTVKKELSIIDNAAGIISEKEIKIAIDKNKHSWVPESIYNKNKSIGKPVYSIKTGKIDTRSERWTNAFKLAEQPKSGGGLNQFGAGMKTASLWLSEFWTVRTKAIGDSKIKKIEWNFDDIMNDEKKEIIAKEEITDRINDSFTKVHLRNLTDNSPIHQHQTLTSCKDYLSSIYRKFLSRDDIIIEWIKDDKSTLLNFEKNPVLLAPKWNNMDGEKYLWKKEINIELPTSKEGGFYIKKSLKGFVALSETMNDEKAGFVFFTHGRVIEGERNNGFIPHFMKTARSRERGRIFGELELSGFKLMVSKNGFVGGSDFHDIFSQYVENEIRKEPLNIVQQAKNYMVQQTTEAQKKKSKKSIQKYAKKYDNSSFSGKSEQQLKKERNQNFNIDQELETTNTNVKIGNMDYSTKINLVESPEEESLYWYKKNDKNKILDITINNTHPVFAAYRSLDPETVLVFVQSICVSEIVMQQCGSNDITDFSYNFQGVLRELIIPK